ncbi:MAG: anthranilate phosphoribosyltransferase [Flavobacteriales bacterium]|nr:anthranilate phosphoribosyltransferase [Flavobacteriales bacterium]
MEFKPTINALMAGAQLTEQEAYDLMQVFGQGVFNESQNAALIISMSSRDLSMAEVQGFRRAMLELSLPSGLEGQPTVDLCGTGGDGKNTFNISTLSSFIVAGAGYKVAKHGNYGVSSLSGSSNVMEQLGYRFSNEPDKLKRQLDELNITFLHAPLFHPAMKHIAPVRKALGIKTFFNVLGPLVNPARTPYQSVGVYNLKLARLYHFILQEEGKRYRVLFGLDGYDEVSLTGPTMTYSSQGEELLEAEDFGVERIAPEAIFGGNTLKESADLFTQILEGDGTEAQRNVVIANSALAIQCFEKDKSIGECQSIAKESLDSRAALRTLKGIIELAHT